MRFSDGFVRSWPLELLKCPAQSQVSWQMPGKTDSQCAEARFPPRSVALPGRALRMGGIVAAVCC